jgi:hypothetical protein
VVDINESTIDLSPDFSAMIESFYWREKLREEIRWLRKNQRYKRWSEKQMVLYERKLMLVAFQIRSLRERPKVAKACAIKELEVKRYEKVGKKPLTKLSMMDFDELFNMNEPKFDLLSVLQICNQLIHYYLMFAPSHEKRNFTTLLVVSDYKRHVCLFEIGISKLIDFFEFFVKEESRFGKPGTGVRWEWNERKKDYDFIEITR